MTSYRVQPSQKISGEIKVAGDKSISHRAVMFGSIAEGTTVIENLLEGEDVLATVDCFRKLGIKIQRQGKKLVVHGRGLKGLKEPKEILYCGNSGTTMRLLMGLLAGSMVRATLTGDASLNVRPMGRVAEPLGKMGARIREFTENREILNERIRLIEVIGSSLHTGKFRIPVASAQVKSALLLAGLMSGKKVIVTEPSKSRDHSERMLKGFGAKVMVKGNTVTLNPVKNLKGQKVIVPGDFSSAAFFVVLGLLQRSAQGRLIIKNVGLNTTRTGALTILERMGGRIRVLKKRIICGEPVGDLEVRPSKLRGVKISGKIIPWLIDEVPILSVAAALANGKTVIRNAEELRVKETDRIQAMAVELSKLNVRVKELKDGLEIVGSQKLQGAQVKSYGDHRVAMSLAVLGSVIDGKTVIEDVDCVKTSFPNFISLMHRVGAKISEIHEKNL